MARIRVIKFKQSSSKNQPKVAYFHSKNYKKVVDSINPKKSSKKAVTSTRRSRISKKTKSLPKKK